MFATRALMALALVAVAAPAAPPVVIPDAPARAPLGGFVEMAQPDEQPLLPELAAAMTAAPPEQLPRLTGLLEKLPRPTPLRGVVQSVRVPLLEREKRVPEALAAAEESLRLLPDDPRPKLITAELLTFNGDAARATDLWLAASLESPEFAKRTDDYLLNAMIGRLTDMGDLKRADLLRARMVEIGFPGGSATARSSRVNAVIRAKAEAGDVAGAQALVPSLIAVDDFLGLYIDRRYQALWPVIAEWAGADLEKEHRIHLEALRREWFASEDVELGTSYARALRAADANEAVVALFLPVLTPGRLAPDAAEIEYLAPVVASALVNLGRGDEAVALLTRLQPGMPAEFPGRGLNLSSNLARIYLELGRAPEAVAAIDRSLAITRTMGSEVNMSARVGMEAVRVCALHAADRDGDAAASLSLVIGARLMLPGAAMTVYSCLGREADARELVAASLEDVRRRAWALELMQPAGPAPHTDYERRQSAFYDAVRNDRRLRAATERVGRILPRPVASTLPAGFDPKPASA